MPAIEVDTVCYLGAIGRERSESSLSRPQSRLPSRSGPPSRQRSTNSRQASLRHLHSRGRPSYTGFSPILRASNSRWPVSRLSTSHPIPLAHLPCSLLVTLSPSSLSLPSLSRSRPQTSQLEHHAPLDRGRSPMSSSGPQSPYSPSDVFPPPPVIPQDAKTRGLPSSMSQADAAAANPDQDLLNEFAAALHDQRRPCSRSTRGYRTDTVELALSVAPDRTGAVMDGADGDVPHDDPLAQTSLTSVTTAVSSIPPPGSRLRPLSRPHTALHEVLPTSSVLASNDLEIPLLNSYGTQLPWTPVRYSYEAKDYVHNKQPVYNTTAVSLASLNCPLKTARSVPALLATTYGTRSFPNTFGTDHRAW